MVQNRKYSCFEKSLKFVRIQHFAAPSDLRLFSSNSRTLKIDMLDMFQVYNSESFLDIKKKNIFLVRQSEKKKRAMTCAMHSAFTPVS